MRTYLGFFWRLPWPGPLLRQAEVWRCQAEARRAARCIAQGPKRNTPEGSTHAEQGRQKRGSPKRRALVVWVCSGAPSTTRTVAFLTKVLPWSCRTASLWLQCAEMCSEHSICSPVAKCFQFSRNISCMPATFCTKPSSTKSCLDYRFQTIPALGETFHAVHAKRHGGKNGAQAGKLRVFPRRLLFWAFCAVSL